jgi:hypothetical protein
LQIPPRNPSRRRQTEPGQHVTPPLGVLTLCWVSQARTRPGSQSQDVAPCGHSLTIDRPSRRRSSSLKRFTSTSRFVTKSTSVCALAATTEPVGS